MRQLKLALLSLVVASGIIAAIGLLFLIFLLIWHALFGVHFGA